MQMCRTIYKTGSLPLILLMALYWCVIMHLPWENNGGYGMDLPLNLLAWCWAGCVMLVLWLSVTCKMTGISSAVVMVFTGCLLLTLPALIRPAEGLAACAAWPRLAGLWAGFFFYFTLVQSKLSRRFVASVFWLLGFAAFVESLFSLAGFYCPDLLPYPMNALALKYSGYAAGIFQQRNVTASFLATGSGALLALLALDGRLFAGNRLSGQLSLFSINAGVVIISFTQALLHSRTGLAGSLIAVLSALMLVFFSRKDAEGVWIKAAMIIMLPAAGFLCGFWLHPADVGDVLVHEGSNAQRLLTLNYTWDMIQIHPWLGWGMGTFEPAFQNFMANLPGGNPGREMMQHPHNETLFIWAEGGIIALAGGLLIAVAWGRLLWRCQSLWRVAALLTMVPILLHTQTEFPLYYSVPHFLVLLILMACADDGNSVIRMPVTSRVARRLIKTVGAGASVYGVYLAFGLFLSSILLGKFEAGTLKHADSIRDISVPSLLQSRQERDISQLRLLRFRENGDRTELERYVQENGVWIQHFMDEDAWHNQIEILKYLGRQEEARQVEVRASELFPWDERFARHDQHK